MKATLRRWRDKLLDRVEIHNDKAGDYLVRYRLIFTNPLGLYLHHFVGDDQPVVLHDHPSWFVSIGLKGAYLEETPDGVKEYRAPWVRIFPAIHRHRLELKGPEKKHCWTLVFRGPKQRTWYFYPADGSRVPWREYLENVQRQHGEENKYLKSLKKK